MKKKERKIYEEEQQEAIDTLNKYFPKGNKKRGEAMLILAIAFWSGAKAERRLK